jgi:O-antigen biosynthesis protein
VPSLSSRLVRRARAGAGRLRRGSRRRLAARIVRVGLFDRAWYERQTGRSWPVEAQAARHYLTRGRQAGLSPHPLVEPEWIDPSGWRNSRRDPLDAYLAGQSARGGPHPLFDDATWSAATIPARPHPGGPLGAFLDSAGPQTPLPCPWAVEPVTLAQARAGMAATMDLVNAQREPSGGAGPGTLPGDRGPGAGRSADPDLVSVVVTLSGGWIEAWSLLEEALAGRPPDAAPVQVVVVDRSSRASVVRIMASRGFADPRVRLVRLPAAGTVTSGWATGLRASEGDRVVLANAVVSARPLGSPPHTPWWQPLAAALADPATAAAAPLVLGPRGLLEHAGLGRHRPGGALYEMFAGAAAEDAADGPPLQVVALGDEVLAARAEDLRRLGDVDTGYLSRLWGAELSARLATQGPDRRRLLIVPDVSVVRTSLLPPAEPADMAAVLQRCETLIPAPPGWDEEAAWRRAGLELTQAEPRPALRRRQVQVTQGPAAGKPALRWAIATAAPFSAHGDRWGDVHFAGALASALRRLGQHVVVERRGVTGRCTVELDEVFVNLRGLDELAPRVGQVNLLWVISHPDLVSPQEVRAYDASFSAGTTWARTMSERAEVTVRPLLQATDPQRFHPDLAVPDTGAAVLFVGNSRGVQRPIVRDAVAAGLDLAVYGTRWEGFLDPRYVRGPYLPNETVGAAYRAAGVLLNDHWADMAAQGFYSNRLFDAVAAGARVISDPVDGLADLFEGAVLEYRTPADLASWAGAGRAAAFPDDRRLLEISARVRAEHSFDARAATLLDTALAVRESRRIGPVNGAVAGP